MEINRYEQKITYDQYIYIRHYLKENAVVEVTGKGAEYCRVNSLFLLDDRETTDYHITVFDYRTIFLEKYTYADGICKIQSAPITRSQCKCFLNRDFAWMKYTSIPLIWEVYRLLVKGRLQIGGFIGSTVESFLYGSEQLKISLKRESVKSIESKFLLDEKKSIGTFLSGNIHIAVSDEYCDYKFGSELVNRRLLPVAGQKKICWG